MKSVLATAVLTLSVLFTAPAISHADFDETAGALENPAFGSLMRDLDSDNAAVRRLAWTWFNAAVHTLATQHIYCRNSTAPLIKHAHQVLLVIWLQGSGNHETSPASIMIPSYLATQWKCPKGK